MREGRPSTTAEVVCFMRATEQTRPEPVRILDDHLAPLFLGPAGRAALALYRAGRGATHHLLRRVEPGLIPLTLARHRFIDDALAAALTAADVAQVVILGAGYDTRAWRFAAALDHRPVIELDFPATQASKLKRARALGDRLPQTNVRHLPTDFLTTPIAERLRAGGFKEGAPTFWIWEGVSMYLSRAAVRETLSALAALSAPGSELGMDFWFYVDDPGLRATALRFTPGALDLLGEPVTFSLHPEDAGPFFERTGFQLADLATAEELELRYIKDGRRVYRASYVTLARIP